MKRVLATVLSLTLASFLSLSAQVRIYTPELISPADGAINQVPNVTLDWNAVTGGNTGVINYEIQLDTDPGFPDPEVFQTEFVSAVQASELLFGDLYYWRVRAIDGADVSDWSAPWSFTVIRRPTLSKPGDALVQNTDVTMEWAKLSGVTNYEFQLDTVGMWNMVDPGVTANIMAVSVADDTSAWMVGPGGMVLYYDGTTIMEQESNVTADLAGVSFVDASNGWAVGKGGVIIHYDGTAWSEQTSGTTADLAAVYFIDESNGWAVGSSGTAGTVMYFDGTAWSEQYSASKNLYAVDFADAINGWAVGKGGAIFHFNGTEWSSQESGVTRDLFAVGFTSATEGWAMGKSGTILQYADGSWASYQHNLTNKDFTGISFMDESNGWAVAKSGVVIAFDGFGWYSQTGGTTTNFTGISLKGTTGFAVGESGLATMFDAGAFTNPILTRNLDSAYTSTTVQDLNFGTPYFWRVRASHPQDVSYWSGSRSFNTVATVTLSKPNNNATDQDLDVLLKWTKLTDRVNFEIQIDDDPTFATPIELATEDIELPAEMLKFGKLYNWRVRAVNINDISDWSTVWQFSTVDQVSLVSPANGATDIKLTPILNWDELTGISDYQVQVHTNSTFEGALIDEVILPTNPSFPVPIVLAKETEYFWRVRAVNGLDSSGWSSTWSFTTLPPVGIDDPASSSGLKIYPNPASSKIWFQGRANSSGKAFVRLTDLLGKPLLEKEIDLSSAPEAMDVSDLSKGIYLIRVSMDGTVITRKLIIEK